MIYDDELAEWEEVPLREKIKHVVRGLDSRSDGPVTPHRGEDRKRRIKRREEKEFGAWTY